MRHTLPPRAKHAGAFLITVTLAACQTGGLDDFRGTLQATGTAETPFAPDAKPGASGADPKIVGYRLMEAGEHELAMKAFQRAAATEGLTTELLSAFGSVNLGLGRLGQAEALMRRATDAPDATPADWNNLGVVLMEQGKTAEAVQILRKAFALSNGEATDIRDNLRIALAKMEKPSYGREQEQDFKLVRRGTADFVIRKTAE